jgi:multidrug efflux pump subunit AcrA (membrane-fusion protein)
MSASKLEFPFFARNPGLWKAAGGAIFLLVALLAIKSFLHTGPEEVPMVQKVSDDSVKLSDEALKNLKIEKVVKGDFPEKLSLMGKISVPEDRTMVVPSRVQGRIEQIYVASGEVVSAGQPLCQIFSADFAVAREEYVQTMAQAKENPADPEVKHMLELSRKKLQALGVSPSDFDRWSHDEHGDTMIVRAPRSGALLGKNAVIGNVVNVGDTLFMIGDLAKVWFAGDIYPEDLRKVHKDQEIQIDPENGAPALRGTLSFISPAIDPNTRTIKIRALMANPGNFLRADMYVQGSIVIQNRVGIIAPKNALVRLHDSVFAFKRLPGNVFQRVGVETDGESTNSVSVSKGLGEGDEVVSEGGLLLDAALSGGSS